ncbi:MAG: hypothetical protein QXK65_01505 [Candidatus Micrarchaeaceae archaeon]
MLRNSRSFSRGRGHGLHTRRRRHVANTHFGKHVKPQRLARKFKESSSKSSTLSDSIEKAFHTERPYPTSYEEVLLTSIISNSNPSATTYESAATFSRILLNLTAGTRALGYRYGMEIGKSLYRLLSSRKPYYWYEESIPDLISFLEKAIGVPASYSLLYSGLRVRIYNKQGLYLGMNMHLFEAGIISGFVTAASKQITYMEEISCSNNGSDYCEFSLSPHRHNEENIEVSSALSRFAEHLSIMVKHPQTQQNSVSRSYHALLILSILRSSYSDAINNISGYFGFKVAQQLFDDKKPNAARISEYLLKTAILLNFGAPTIKPSKDRTLLNMVLAFSPEVSKKEYVELSRAFINAMLSKAAHPRVSFEIDSRDSNYLLRIKENP